MRVRVEEHVPEAHTLGAVICGLLTVMLSTDTHLLPQNHKGITNLN